MVPVYSKYTKTLTFENFCPKLNPDYLAAARASPDLLSFVRLRANSAGAADGVAERKGGEGVEGGAGGGSLMSVDGLAVGV
jgi:hypothetical protein